MKSKLLILFILIMLCVGTSAFAITYEDFMGFINEAQAEAQTNNNGRLYWAITHLKGQNWFEDYLFSNYSTDLALANTISIQITQDTTTNSYSYATCYLRMTNFDNDTVFYKDGSFIKFSKNLNKVFNGGEIGARFLSLNINSNNVTTTVLNQNYGSLAQLPFAFGTSATFIFLNENNSKIYSNISGSSITTDFYYVKNYDGIPPEPVPTWTFTKYNNLKLNYSVNEMPLGTFSGDVNPSELNYIWVDYTTQQTIYNSFDYTGMYPSIYSRGMSLFIYNRLLKDHEYDLYIYKDNEDTQQFHYTYIYTSGDSGGWNGQDTTNNIIDNNNQIQEDNTKQPDFDNYKVSGDSIISSLGVTFSGDPYDNVWFMLINGFSESLTSDNSLRKWTLSLPGNTNYIIDLDVIHNSIPDAVRTILTLVSSAFLTIKMLKWVKIITDMVSSGNIDEVLQMNEEERHY